MHALINCHSGLAGNMFLGALIDAGTPIDLLTNSLQSLELPNWELSVSKVKVNGIDCTLANFIHTQDHHHRNIQKINDIIDKSKLPDKVKIQSKQAFDLLAKAEANAHGCELEKVHFHEVGAIDCILDITGTFLAFDYLKVDTFYATPINLGGGTAKCAHGTMPVPVPAVTNLLKGLPVFSNTHLAELTTPTGAAILATLTPSFEPIELAAINTFGYGAGTHKYEGSNYLSITILEDIKKTTPSNVLELETNIDDINPETYEFVIDQLMAKGAVDVFLTPIIMKKSRPAVKLSVLCKPADLPEICQEIFLQTGSFGIRICSKERITLDSTFVESPTPWGNITFRQGRLNNEIISIKPEYEDLKKIALEQNIPLNLLYKKLKYDPGDTK